MYKRLVNHFSVLEDPRCAGKVVHRLIDILVIAVCAVIAGAESWEDIELYGKEKADWLATFLPLQNGTPSHDTFRRLFMIIDSEAIERCFLEWVASFSSIEQDEVVAIDGKTLRRSFDLGKKQKPFHIVSAFSTRQGMTIGQRKVDGKSNEITAIPELLDSLNLKNSIITIDAMGCQRVIAEKIVAQKADYILALKGNQKRIHEAVKNYCDEHCFRVGRSIDPTEDYFDDSHGRCVRRRAFVCPKACDLPELQQWPGLRQVLAVETIRQVANQNTTQCEIRYFLSSCDAPAKEQIQAIRSHWGIENSLHWVLDMSFREDECRIRDSNAAYCFAILRKIALNLIRQDSISKNSIRAKRKKAGWSNAYMTDVLFGKFRA
jgi:predicted transposase YbfD/YdcC